jgi:hypothetical protein
MNEEFLKCPLCEQPIPEVYTSSDIPKFREHLIACLNQILSKSKEKENAYHANN